MYLIQISKENPEHLLLTFGAVGMLSGNNCNQLITRSKAWQKGFSEIVVYDFLLLFFLTAVWAAPFISASHLSVGMNQHAWDSFSTVVLNNCELSESKPQPYFLLT